MSKSFAPRALDPALNIGEKARRRTVPNAFPRPGMQANALRYDPSCSIDRNSVIGVLLTQRIVEPDRVSSGVTQRGVVKDDPGLVLP